jgi:hypothetical protein
VVIDHHHNHREASMVLHQVINKGLRQPLTEDNRDINNNNNNILLLKLVFTVFLNI